MLPGRLRQEKRREERSRGSTTTIYRHQPGNDVENGRLWRRFAAAAVSNGFAASWEVTNGLVQTAKRNQAVDGRETRANEVVRDPGLYNPPRPPPTAIRRTRARPLPGPIADQRRIEASRSKEYDW